MGLKEGMGMDIYAQMNAHLVLFGSLAVRAKECYPHLEEQNEDLIQRAMRLVLLVDTVDSQTATPVYQ